MAGKTVAVTGASGYIASVLVKDLLEKGYNVRGTVRDPDKIEKVKFLLELPGAKARLTLYKANLLEEGSFDEVVKGVDGVFHTASPFFSDSLVKDPQAELLDPALKGTLNLLRAVAKADTVKRVVLTSSVAAVAYQSRPRTKDTVYDENSWSDEDFARQGKSWYVLSKLLAEKAAWEFVKKAHIDLVTINPVFVVGTMLPNTLNTSAEIILKYLNGEEKSIRNFASGLVDVHDVSLAHILAYEKPEAEGRYILCDRVVHQRNIADILRRLFPEYTVTKELSYDPAEEVPEYTVSNEKAKKLGVVFKPVETQLKEMVDSLKEKGYLK